MELFQPNRESPAEHELTPNKQIPIEMKAEDKHTQAQKSIVESINRFITRVPSMTPSEAIEYTLKYVDKIEKYWSDSSESYSIQCKLCREVDEAMVSSLSKLLISELERLIHNESLKLRVSLMSAISQLTRGRGGVKGDTSLQLQAYYNLKYVTPSPYDFYDLPPFERYKTPEELERERHQANNTNQTTKQK